MVNKMIGRTHGIEAPASIFSLFRRIGWLVCCAFILVHGKTAAQNLSKYYVSSVQPTGILYFILPQTNFNNPDTKKDFIIDVTYLNSKDSATVNFTFLDKENINPETITIAYSSWKYQTPVKRIYVDTEKDQWRYRYTFSIPFDQLVLFYKAKDPAITLSTGSAHVVSVKTVKQWEKNAEINNRIVQIIQKNKI